MSRDPVYSVAVSGVVGESGGTVVSGLMENVQALFGVGCGLAGQASRFGR